MLAAVLAACLLLGGCFGTIENPNAGGGAAGKSAPTAPGVGTSDVAPPASMAPDSSVAPQPAWQWARQPALDYDVMQPLYDYYFSGTKFLAYVNVQKDGRWGTLTFDGDVVFDLYEGEPLSVCADEHAHGGPPEIEQLYYQDQAAAQKLLEEAGFPFAFSGGHGVGGELMYYYFPATDEYVLYGGGDGPMTPVDEWGGYTPTLPAVLPYVNMPAGLTRDDLNDYDNYEKVEWIYGLLRTEDMAVLTPNEYEYVLHERYGFYALLKNDKWGYFSVADERLVAECVYDATWASPNGYWMNIGFFTDGLCPVAQGGKYGFIDTQGKLVVPLEFDGASHVYQGRAWVQQDGLWGQITIDPAQ
ncbi:MAG: WG repeat-containing protein [Oscillospiraceae bacterium]